MKTAWLLALLLMVGNTLQAQAYSVKPITQESKIFTFVERNPEFPGGDMGIIKFLQQNIKYPKRERNKRIEGKVLIRFVVDADGSVKNVIVVKSVSDGLDKEAVRVVKMLPKFKPGFQQGKPVMVYYNLPIKFTLN